MNKAGFSPKNMNAAPKIRANSRKSVDFLNVLILFYVYAFIMRLSWAGVRAGDNSRKCDRRYPACVRRGAFIHGWWWGTGPGAARFQRGAVFAAAPGRGGLGGALAGSGAGLGWGVPLGLRLVPFLRPHRGAGGIHGWGDRPRIACLNLTCGIFSRWGCFIHCVTSVGGLSLWPGD
jgi:hypothetical protein